MPVLTDRFLSAPASGSTLTRGTAIQNGRAAYRRVCYCFGCSSVFNSSHVLFHAFCDHRIRLRLRLIRRLRQLLHIGGWTWTASITPPHGYRSAVQYSTALKLWVTAGANGSDISRDDGKTWQPLDDGNWNALSLPFIVGPNGRIAHLNPTAIPKP